MEHQLDPQVKDYMVSHLLENLIQSQASLLSVSLIYLFTDSQILQLSNLLDKAAALQSFVSGIPKCQCLPFQ